MSIESGGIGDAGGDACQIVGHFLDRHLQDQESRPVFVPRDVVQLLEVLLLLRVLAPLADIAKIILQPLGENDLLAGVRRLKSSFSFLPDGGGREIVTLRPLEWIGYQADAIFRRILTIGSRGGIIELTLSPFEDHHVAIVAILAVLADLGAQLPSSNLNLVLKCPLALGGAGSGKDSARK